LHPPRNNRGEHLLLREINATNALAFLGQRGFDIDWIVRFGLAQDLPTRLALWVIESTRETSVPRPEWIAPWLDAFERHVGVSDFDNIGQSLAAADKSGFINWIGRWLQQAKLEDIVAWAMIDAVEDTALADDGQARWAMDRFTKTYLRDWSKSSLVHEYHYLRGMRDAPVAVAEMRYRQLSEVDVDRELARRSVEDTPSRLEKVKGQALALLDEGRRREAAALFDAARILEPQDAEAHNNYGFCLTPDDAADALAALIRAEELGITSRALNLLNQAVALRALGRAKDALDTAERAYAATGGRSEPAWLWVNMTAPDGPTVGDSDLLTYLGQLGCVLAEELDDRNRLDLWRERLSEAGSPTG
jgi:tetratricopeptide (TPR) repeat protein